MHIHAHIHSNSGLTQGQEKFRRKFFLVRRSPFIHLGEEQNIIIYFSKRFDGKNSNSVQYS
jgi:hypothetical protein